MELQLNLGAKDSRLNSACSLHAGAELDDSMTHLGSPWGSAIDFGGAKIRSILVFSLGAVRSNCGMNSACNLHADAELDDGISHLAPPMGGLQLSSGEQEFAPKSHSRSELSAQTMD